MRATRWLVLGASFLAACSEPRQALVELEIERPLLAELAFVDVSALDAHGEPRGGSAQLDLSEAYVKEGRVSFGAVPARDGSLALRIQGRDRDGELLIEQVLEASTKKTGVTKVAMVLSSECLRRIPCPSPSSACLSRSRSDGDDCDPGAADPVEPPPSDCLLGTVLDCGACGRTCNMSHVLLSACVAEECAGTCSQGWDDCDHDIASNGCETQLSSDPQHCGSCTNPACPYGVCLMGRCERSCDGVVFPGLPAYTRDYPPNRMIGTKLFVRGEGSLAGLGVNVEREPARTDAKFRMALYEHDPRSNAPGRLVGQTAETSVHALGRARSGALNDCNEAALEMRVSLPAPLSRGEYWLFIISNAELVLRTEAIQVQMMKSQDDVDYASLEEMPEIANEGAPLRSYLERSPDVYVVRTPEPNTD